LPTFCCFQDLPVRRAGRAGSSRPTFVWVTPWPRTYSPTVPSTTACPIRPTERGPYSSGSRCSNRPRSTSRRAWPGIAIELTLIVGSLEFVGPFEEKGWKLAGTIVPIAYTAWSLWLVISGIMLLIA
jgi:hypothetical protein